MSSLLTGSGTRGRASDPMRRASGARKGLNSQASRGPTAVYLTPSEGRWIELVRAREPPSQVRGHRVPQTATRTATACLSRSICHGQAQGERITKRRCRLLCPPSRRGRETDTSSSYTRDACAPPLDRARDPWRWRSRRRRACGGGRDPLEVADGCDSSRCGSCGTGASFCSLGFICGIWLPRANLQAAEVSAVAFHGIPFTEYLEEGGRADAGHYFQKWIDILRAPSDQKL
ncbi:hypothetical protein BC830DRAFT_617702 [Chytriomyces sp. MP71]|nr:hypothetical protein BC830DRAFT_617702 [Chytriomyces sp. MP71]